MNQQDSLQQTPLHSLHVHLQARMVPFAGYEMPVQYQNGIKAEHHHTRTQAGLFDVSHMGQIEVRGEDIAALLETELPVDLESLQAGRQKYALLLNDGGGIRDDLMVMNLGDSYRLVVNAACKHADLDYLQNRLGDSLEFALRDDLALLALQGPASADVLNTLGVDESALAMMKFMHVLQTEVAGLPCTISRSGYTGEDGFEISLSAEHAVTLAGSLLELSAVSPVGLGARDTLRLEAGLCLYGQDITTDTSPVEAGLNWAISPARRSGGSRPGGFPGADRILSELKHGARRKLVGLNPEGRSPMRAGTRLVMEDDPETGEITSGGFGPTLEHPVSMGYVPTEHASPGTRLAGEVRGKLLPLTVVRLPFVPHRYYR